MTNDERNDMNDSQALTGGDTTKCRAFVSTHQLLVTMPTRSASMQVCCEMANPSVSDMERIKRIGKYLVGKPCAECLSHWQQSGELEAYSDADSRGDKSTRRCQLE